MVQQGAALPILYVVPHVTIRGVLYAQPVSRAGYSNVHLRHLGRCNDVPTEFYIVYFYDLCLHVSCWYSASVICVSSQLRSGVVLTYFRSVLTNANSRSGVEEDVNRNILFAVL